MKELSWLSNEELVEEIRMRLHKQSVVELPDNYYELEEQIRKLSLQLRESENGKSSFLSNVRNEINNPITSILGLSNTLLSTIGDPSAKKICGLIHDQVFDLNLQMRNIITAAEIEMGGVKPVFSRVNVSQLVKDQIDFMSPMVKRKHVQVKCDIGEELTFISDASLLQEILINLIANAIEFSHNGATVELSAIQKGEVLVLEVSDNGIGIKEEEQEFIFQRFKQTDSGMRKVHRGHGLGLAIVQELMDMLESVVHITSALNKGTTVTLHLLPVSEQLVNNDSTFGNDVIFEGPQEEF